MSKLRLPVALLLVLTLILVTLELWSPLLHKVLAPRPVFPLALHTTVEVFSIVISMAVFAISWQTYPGTRSASALILGCGFLCVGLLDFAHMMSYKGMPDFFTPASPHKAIVFWLQARYIAALTLLTIALRNWAPVASLQTPRWLLSASLAASLSLCLLLYVSELMFPDFWPLTFVEGQGLTPIKITLEYVLIALLLPAAWMLYRQSGNGANARATHLLTAVLITILSELCFTLYTNVYSSYSLLGHLYKIIAYLFIYQAIFVGAVREPYARLQEETSQRAQAERTAEYLAYHDTLTQTPNRALLQNRFLQARAPQRRRHGDKHVAVVFADIDKFKLINDTYGHGVGDELLAVSAQRLSQILRKTDTLSRYASDQFVILLPDLDLTDNAQHVLQKILHSIQQPFVLQDREIMITLSLGVALSEDEHDDLDSLIHKSETAMAQAKAAGGNNYRYFDDTMNAAASEYLKIRNGLRKAIERKEFELHYQPQIDLLTRKVVGVEALVRWNHPEWGSVPPSRFIPVAEDCHLIIALGNWILDEACRQAVIWQNLGLPPLRVAVNLSALQFECPDFEKRLTTSLDNAGLDYRLLELELTESILMQDSEGISAMLKRLRRMGIRIALDDFGTGYSSLSYLRHFDVDTLKIDQSFTRGIAEHEHDLAIVNAVIQMAHSLGLQVIAEGVETEAMCEVLERFGCDEGQGYLFARPMSAADFLDFMRDERNRTAA